MPEPRHQPAALIDLAARLLAAAGIEADRARLIGELLVEADLMGHTTHGLALLPGYLDELAAGTMTKAGEPEVVRDTGPCLTWDGRRLPGVWLTAQAIDTAIPRARQYGTATVVIRRSHHIACLGAFLTRATDQGLMILLASSDPSVASVAPFGGTTPVFTPDPIAVGIPTDGRPDPDRHQRLDHHQRHERPPARRGPPLPACLAARRRRQPDRRPAACCSPSPPGTILPSGGLDHGHKGYALALMVEALTMGLGGFGRAEPAEGWGASVFVQVLDPDAFAGGDALPPPDRLDRRRLPRLARRGPASSGCACPARRPSPAAPRPWPKASSSIPASWRA